MRENINVYKALIAETGVMRLPGRYRRIWQDNIKMDLKQNNERVWNGTIYLGVRANCRILGTVMNLLFP
jgi:hypothetical protein